jgi:hypothetical protein
MATCEKCWDDAYSRSWGGSEKTQSEHYQDLLEERKGNPCSPEEQCGENHLLLDWKDGTRHCVCGSRSRRLDHTITDPPYSEREA